ncbi:cytokine-like nuclear factor N-PAC [Ambystoma mexicanum]|uniref:cytokine-like nuclear factor N-PAC n=1 Tax=Ambystoma mexicanum TaxID=8296 RepID=UPI0037E99C4C
MAAPVAVMSLRHGDLVWGKLGKYPPWPGKIVSPPKDLKRPPGKKCFFVKFFGTEDHAWIRVEQLKPYHTHKEEMCKTSKGKRFQHAVDAVEEFLKKAKARELAKEQASSEEKKPGKSSEEKSKKTIALQKRKLDSRAKKVAGDIKKKKPLSNVTKKKGVSSEVKKRKILSSEVKKKKILSIEMKKKIPNREIKKKLLTMRTKKQLLSATGKKKTLTGGSKKNILAKKTLTAQGKKKSGTKKILNSDGKKVLVKKILPAERKKKILSANSKKTLTTDGKRKAQLAIGKKKILPTGGKRKVVTADRKKTSLNAAAKKILLLSTNHGSKSHLKGLEKQSSRKRGRPPKDDKVSSVPESSSMKRLAMGTLAGFKWQSAFSEPVNDDPHFHHFLLSQSEKPVSYQASSKRFKLSDEEMGSTSIQAADSTAANGSINPTDKRIGFLGLGLIGSGIVSNLLKMGHTVTVWNRTAEKCDLFIQEGARLGRTPAEVVSTCDITFSCVADPKAAKDLVLGPSGVLQGIRAGKCYVDMSTVDPETIVEVSRVIVSRGGRFLEAPVSGNQQLSNDGMLLILAAGDRGVYEDCSSCFKAMGKTSFFLGDVGNAAKMMLILSMVQGSFMATIAEGLTLAQVTGQSQQTLLDILNEGQLASIFLDQKCQNILQGNFKPDLYLKYIQKDLRLAIALGDSVNHPTPMAAAANEVYKRAKALDQSDNDMSAVYRAYIH